MQNKTLSFLSTLLLSAACISFSVSAQEAAQTTQQASQPTMAQPTPQPTTTQPTPQPTETQAETAADIAARAQAAKKILEESLTTPEENTERTAVNFPSRPSLGAIELAPLPGVQETLITGPAPVEKSISKKDLPSEQLLGRITSEVFQEMADLERGNAFLKLQMQKETLRNDLEKLKTQYRESRLAEISKREDIIKERIKWWQEQEEQRLLLEKKKQEAALIEQQIADAEATRERLRQEALDRRARAQQMTDQNTTGDKTASASEKSSKVTPVSVEIEFKPVNTLYTLVGVKGIRGELNACLKESDGTELTVRKGERLPSGHIVQSITKDKLTTSVNGIEEVLTLVPASRS